MLTKLLKQVQEIGGALIPPPLSEAKTKALKNNAQGYPIPEDYLQWLKIADGFYWAGLEFFGSCTHQQDVGCITDLLVQNDLYRALSADTKTLIVGKTDDENFVYNISKGRYEIRAEFSNEKIKSFSNFEKMMSYLLKEQIELLQNYVAFNEEAEELPQDD